MGWESILTTALSVGGEFLKSNQAAGNAKREAQAIVDEGNIKAKNKAREVMYKAGTQRVSFLNSGLTLEGTPMNVIDQTFDTGIEDINQIASNYNNKAKATISSARSSMISNLANSFSGFGVPGGAVSGLREQTAYALNNAGFGNTAYEMLDGT